MAMRLSGQVSSAAAGGGGAASRGGSPTGMRSGGSPTGMHSGGPQPPSQPAPTATTKADPGPTIMLLLSRASCY